MRQSDEKLKEIKKQLESMFDVLLSQLAKGKAALDTFDKGIAAEIKDDEQKLDEFETAINYSCETFLARYTPVAADLRLVMAINSINPSLERIGDIVEKIAKYVNRFETPLPDEVEQQFMLDEMYEHIMSMFATVREAFYLLDTTNLKKIYEKDWVVNKINKGARETVIEMLELHKDKSAQILKLFLLINKLERAGDLIKNIGEEIIFAKEGKIMRHTQI
jgi:phosphate transport system protein